MAQPDLQWSLFDGELADESADESPLIAAVPQRHVTFLHTADWQLGMTRKYLSADAAHAYAAARLDAVERIGVLANEVGAQFVVVCGDVFEDHRVSARLITQTLDRLGHFDVPVYLLPGNHDPLDATSVYRSTVFLSRRPDNVTVLEKPGVVRVSDDADLVVAPWSHKAPVTDLVGAQVDSLDDTDRIRVVVGHGGTDAFPMGTDPARISVAPLESALDDELIDYVALGDRHSLTEVGASGRVWYPGAPEVTNFDNVETAPGNVLAVTLSRGSGGRTVDVSPHQVGQWAFSSLRADVNSAADVEALARTLDAVADKSRTVLQLGLVGALTLAENAELERLLDAAADSFAAIRRWDAHDDLVVRADAHEVGEWGLGGYAAQAAEDLADQAAGADAQATAARDALALLARLSGRVGQ